MLDPDFRATQMPIDLLLSAHGQVAMLRKIAVRKSTAVAMGRSRGWWRHVRLPGGFVAGDINSVGASLLPQGSRVFVNAIPTTGLEVIDIDARLFSPGQWRLTACVALIH